MAMGVRLNVFMAKALVLKEIEGKYPLVRSTSATISKNFILWKKDFDHHGYVVCYYVLDITGRPLFWVGSRVNHPVLLFESYLARRRINCASPSVRWDMSARSDPILTHRNDDSIDMSIWKIAAMYTKDQRDWGKFEILGLRFWKGLRNFVLFCKL